MDNILTGFNVSEIGTSTTGILTAMAPVAEILLGILLGFLIITVIIDIFVPKRDQDIESPYTKDDEDDDLFDL